MPSKRELILTHIRDLLQAGGDLGATVTRSRQAAITRTDGPSVVIEPVIDTPSDLGHLMFEWKLTVSVTTVVRGDVPDEIADPILNAIHSRVLQDPTLNGYAYNVQPLGSSWDMISADRDAAIITTTFEVQYRTSQDDLTQ